MVNKIPENTGEFFEIINTHNRVFIMKDNSRRDFNLMPFDSLDVYKSGFRYIGLKEGAEKLFKSEKLSDLIVLINQAKRKEDVLILAKVSDSEKVQEAVSSKLKEF